MCQATVPEPSFGHFWKNIHINFETENFANVAYLRLLWSKNGRDEWVGVVGWQKGPQKRVFHQSSSLFMYMRYHHNQDSTFLTLLNSGVT